MALHVLTGDGEASCTKKLQAATETAEQAATEMAETAQQKCNDEKRKLEAEIDKLDERVKQLRDDLQVEKQRVVDQQFSTQRLLLRLRQQEEQLVRHRPDDLAGQSPQQKSRRKDEQGSIGDRTPGQTEPNAYQPRNQVRDQGGFPHEPAQQMMSGKDQGRLSQGKTSREASGPMTAGQRDQAGLSQGQTRSDKEVNLPQQRQSDVNRPSPLRQQVVGMEQNHEEYPQRSDSQLELTKNSSSLTTAGTLFQRRRPQYQQSNYSDDEGISPRREFQPSLQGQRGDVGDDAVVKRGERLARRDTHSDEAGTQDQQPATVM